MRYGIELPNEDRCLTSEEMDKLQVYEPDFVRLRYARRDVTMQCLTVNPAMIFVLRPRLDGYITWGWELREATALIENYGGKVIINTVNEPNHPQGPYYSNFRAFYREYQEHLGGLYEDQAIVSPNLAVMAKDLQWSYWSRGLFGKSGYIGTDAYWQWDNELSPTWGLRITKFRKHYPKHQFIVLEVGDTTPSRSSREKAEHIARNLKALSGLDYVWGASIFMLGGTEDWKEFYLEAEDLASIREGLLR